MIGYTRTWDSFDIEEYQRNGEILRKAIEEGTEIFGMENASARTFEAVKNAPMRGLCPTFTAVNDLDTAMHLREQGLTLPILVLGQPDPEDVSEYVKKLHHGFIAQSVETLKLARALSGRAMLFGGVLRLHLKVEMSSDGEGLHYLNEDDPIDDLAAAMCSGGTYCEGIFTELSRSDGAEVNEQKISAFLRLADRLEEVRDRKIAVRHYFMK